MPPEGSTEQHIHALHKTTGRNPTNRFTKHTGKVLSGHLSSPGWDEGGRPLMIVFDTHTVSQQDPIPASQISCCSMCFTTRTARQHTYDWGWWDRYWLLKPLWLLYCYFQLFIYVLPPLSDSVSIIVMPFHCTPDAASHSVQDAAPDSWWRVDWTPFAQHSIVSNACVSRAWHSSAESHFLVDCLWYIELRAALQAEALATFTTPQLWLWWWLWLGTRRRRHFLPAQGSNPYTAVKRSESSSTTQAWVVTFRATAHANNAAPSDNTQTS
jgi:hypothetical protein